jgi:hypothetical protein
MFDKNGTGHENTSGEKIMFYYMAALGYKTMLIP